jgi:uncharacterized membrane protein YphA (DoxX/SURF4 family)
MAGMSRIPTILRLLLGLGFTFFGLNYFLELMKTPPPPAPAVAFMTVFVTTKFLALVKLIEVGAGLLLLANRFVPLALTLLAPITVGMLYFHARLDPAGIVPALVFAAIEIVLAWSYRGAFAPMLRARVNPASLR